MANPEHVKILKQGVEVWNQWREENPDIRPILDHTNLRGADLTAANLYRADLARSDVRDSHLAEANLCEAMIRGANLFRADLSKANLRAANLMATNLSQTFLQEVDLTEGECLWTLFADVDLSTVQGLETIRHNGPSTLGIDTIYKSFGNIPEVFLRGCGVPDEFITYMHSLVQNPIQYYSCFISYSSKDTLLAERLYADLQARGVRCWFAPHDLFIGARIRPTIDESIRKYDKLLLLLSRYSVMSDWVEQEVETAQRRERTQKRVVLFPIQLDNAVTKIETGWPAYIRNTRNMGDFRKWKQQEHYQKAFERLLRDLKIDLSIL